MVSRSVNGDQVAITFRHVNSYVVFKARLLYGLVSYSVTDYSVPTTTVHAPPTTAHPPTTRPPVTNPPTTTTTQPDCGDECDDD